MKVYQINTVCGYGSTGRIAVAIANYIDQQGGNCLIAYGRKNKEPDYRNTYYIGNKLDHYLHGILSRITDRQGFYSKIATNNLIKNIIDYDPDVIQLHNVHGYYLNMQALFGFFQTYKKPIVWTFHDCWPFTGHCTYFDMVDCVKWKTQCENCPQKKKYPTSFVMDQSYKNYNEKKQLFSFVKNLHIVTPSLWLHKLVKESFLGKMDCRVINNGIDLNKFNPVASNIRERYNIGNRVILLGVASNWSANVDDRKGFHDFIKLSHILKEDAVIIMVGVTGKIKTQLPSNIIAIERTNNIKELCELYTVADYFLNLTYEDNFPTTNIEALACGTPVVTYNTGGSVECITPRCGVIIEKGKYDAVFKTINKRRFNPSDCIKRARQYSSIERYKDYYNLYCELTQ